MNSDSTSLKGILLSAVAGIFVYILLAAVSGLLGVGSVEVKPTFFHLLVDARNFPEIWVGNYLILEVNNSLTQNRQRLFEFDHANNEPQRYAILPNDWHFPFSVKGRVPGFIQKAVII